MTEKKNTKLTEKPKRCPHGIKMTQKPKMLAFAGAISLCVCCHNSFGHFGGVAFARRICPQCEGPDPKAKARLLQRLEDLKVAVKADRISLLAIILAHRPLLLDTDGRPMVQDIAFDVHEIRKTAAPFTPIFTELAKKCEKHSGYVANFAQGKGE